jgi:hypothetical protein
MQEMDNQKNRLFILYSYIVIASANANNRRRIDMLLGIPVKTENEGAPGPYCDARIEFAFSDPLRQMEWIALLELQRILEKSYKNYEVQVIFLEKNSNHSLMNFSENELN